MLDIGWPEFVVILVVALIVIGPKDLPRALHTVGKWVRKARMLAREFQSGVDEMVRQAELEDLKKQVEQARSLNLRDQLEKHVDPQGAVREALTIDERLPDPLGDLIDDGRSVTKPATATSPPAPATPQPDPAGQPLQPAVAQPAVTMPSPTQPAAAPVAADRQG